MPLPVLSQVHPAPTENGLSQSSSQELSRTLILSSLTFPWQLHQPCFYFQEQPGFLLKDIPMACNPVGSLHRDSNHHHPALELPGPSTLWKKQGSEESVRFLGARRTLQCIKGLGPHPAVCRCWLPNKMFHAGRAIAVSTKLLYFQDNPPPWFSQ